MKEKIKDSRLINWIKKFINWLKAINKKLNEAIDFMSQYDQLFPTIFDMEGE